MALDLLHILAGTVSRMLCHFSYPILVSLQRMGFSMAENMVAALFSTCRGYHNAIVTASIILGARRYGLWLRQNCCKLQAHDAQV